MEVNITNNAVEQFLNDYFYTPYKERNMDGKTLELIFTPQCNLKCSYCYLWKNKNNLFSGCEYNKEKILNNLKLVLKWLEKNHFCPTLDLFSGEFFAQTLGYEALEIIYNHQKEVEPQYRIPALFIPTNMTFLGSDELTAKVDEFRDKFAELDIKLFLSASIDGKYIATNRSYDKDLDIEINLVRDDAYYDKVFDYCVKHNILFHPMIYSKNIENWKDNFLWFKENLEKRGASVWSVYLLEVRNEEWTQTEIKHFQDFVRFLYDLLWEEKGHDVNAFVK